MICLTSYVIPAVSYDLFDLQDGSTCQPWCTLTPHLPQPPISASLDTPYIPLIDGSWPPQYLSSHLCHRHLQEHIPKIGTSVLWTDIHISQWLHPDLQLVCSGPGSAALDMQHVHMGRHGCGSSSWWMTCGWPLIDALDAHGGLCWCERHRRTGRLMLLPVHLPIAEGWQVITSRFIVCGFLIGWRSFETTFLMPLSRRLYHHCATRLGSGLLHSQGGLLTIQVSTPASHKWFICIKSDDERNECHLWNVPWPFKDGWDRYSGPAAKMNVHNHKASLKCHAD